MQIRFSSKCALAVSALLLLLLASACEFGNASYRPPFSPISFSISSSGISLSAGVGVVTPMGEFSYQYPLSSKTVDDGTLLLDIRYRKDGVVMDKVYSIRTNNDEVSVTTNGRTVITISNHRVLIDATGGDVQTVEVRDGSGDSGTSFPTATPPPPPLQVAWNQSYDAILYQYQGRSFRPTSGNHFVVVSVTLFNQGQTMQSFALNPTFVLYSEGDRQSWNVARFMSTTVTLRPQSQTTLDVVFVVPNDACNYGFSVSALGSSSRWTDACHM